MDVVEIVACLPPLIKYKLWVHQRQRKVHWAVFRDVDVVIRTLREATTIHMHKQTLHFPSLAAARAWLADRFPNRLELHARMLMPWEEHEGTFVLRAPPCLVVAQYSPQKDLCPYKVNFSLQAGANLTSFQATTIDDARQVILTWAQAEGYTYPWK